MPDYIHTRVTRAIYAFLWNDKTKQVKRETFQLPFSLGGLAVINPAEKAIALQLRGVPRIGDPTCQAKWVFLARYWIGFTLNSRVQVGLFSDLISARNILGILRHDISKASLQQSIDCISISPYCLTTKSTFRCCSNGKARILSDVP